MSRTFICITIFFVCFTLVSFAWADEAEDVRQIKNVIYREEEGVYTGDVDKIISCYAPGFVAIAAFSDSAFYSMSRGEHHFSIDPENWVVGGVGSKIVREYAEGFKGRADWMAKHPDFRHGVRVRHVHVNGDNAIAVSMHWRSWSDLATRENVRTEHRTVWMLAKIKGEWKATSFIAQVTRSQMITKMRPE